MERALHGRLLLYLHTGMVAGEAARPTNFHDLWVSLRLMFNCLDGNEARPAVGSPRPVFGPEPENMAPPGQGKL